FIIYTHFRVKVFFWLPDDTKSILVRESLVINAFMVCSTFPFFGATAPRMGVGILTPLYNP
ncbi:MAG: hypothetical protein IJT36_08770, partial [Alphaproteobacteria bacterium]|nr:hypothetical protein [Alphaproteobacteria bacterium]